jgi:hypothetical protein
MEWNGMECGMWNVECGMEYYFYWMIINEITPLGGVKRYSEKTMFKSILRKVKSDIL